MNFTNFIWQNIFVNTSKMLVSDRELRHSISKLIGDEEGTLKSFIVFDITSRGSIFRVVVRSQIVVLPTIPSQWHSCDSNLWPWLWYHLLDHELRHSTLKPIGDEKGTLKSFMAFDITPYGLVFRVVVGSQTVVPNSLSLQKVPLKIRTTSNPILVFSFLVIHAQKTGKIIRQLFELSLYLYL